jgi:hypothetical protein
MYSHKDKFIYVHIPKCGGTFIKHFLLSNIDDRYKDNQDFSLFQNDYDLYSEAPLNVVCKKIPNWKDYYIFSIVRNPFDRVTSMFSFLGGWKYEDIKKRRVNMENLPLFEKFNKFYKDKDFDGFVEFCFLTDELKKFHGGYFDSYVDRLTPPNGNHNYVNVFKLEYIEKLIHALCDKYKFDSKIFTDWRQNSSKDYRLYNDYKSYYTDKSYNLVKEHFNLDLEVYNYEF